MPDSPIVALFRSAIGPVNREYYLPILTRFESLGRVGPSWSWAAGLYTLNWMVYRRLWRQAVIYLAALICVLATAAIIQLAAQPSLPVQIAGVLTLLSLAIGIPGLLGNAWLYADIRNRMTQAIATSKTMAEAGVLLSQQASTRQGFIRQLIANAAIVGVVGVGYLLMPVSEKVSVSDAKPVKTVTQVVTPPALTALTLPATTASSIAAVVSAPIPPTVAALAAASAPLMVIEPPVPPAPDEAPGATAPPTPKAKPKSHATLVDSIKSSSKKQEKPESVVKPKARASSPDSDAAPRIAYFVNVGLFSKEQNASAALSQLVAAGMMGTTQQVDVGSKKLTRVRSGPFETRADATEAAVKIRLLNLEAKVFTQAQP